MKTDVELDARGLNCPLPILRARQALRAMQGGQILRIVATDPGSVQDFTLFARQTGHTLLDLSKVNGEYTILICKG